MLKNGIQTELSLTVYQCAPLKPELVSEPNFDVNEMTIPDDIPIDSPDCMWNVLGDSHVGDFMMPAILRCWSPTSKCLRHISPIYVTNDVHQLNLLSDFVVDIGSYKPEINDMTITKVIRKPVCDPTVNLILAIKSLAPNRTEFTGP